MNTTTADPIIAVHTDPEASENRGLIFEFASESGEDPAANAARWDRVYSWIEANVPDNRSSGGLLNGRRAYVTLRFAEDRVF